MKGDRGFQVFLPIGKWWAVLDSTGAPSPATNWLKATCSSAHNTLFIDSFSRMPSPHFC
jgi:hypothetical protein